MTMPALIEAVPNFSEGRRPEVVELIAQAIQTPGVILLHRTSDPDHNRSVLTVAGPPAAVMEGLFAATATAARLIDLDQHQGAHPRLGATDVIPLVPIQGISLEACADLAHQLARRIGEELGLPVYCYEAAALRPERRNLADVRRGEYEKLRQEIHLPERQPDFGPAQVGPAGAVIVGARPFLIAFNVFLQSDDVQIAKRIANSVRERGGGLPAVKALGMLVEGQAQVSMNLVDFHQTPPHVVVARIRKLAADAGVAVDRSELIGLIPQDAIFAAAAHSLGLPDFTPDRVIEVAIARQQSQSAQP